MTAQILPFPSRPELVRRSARDVACPYCGAEPGRPCTVFATTMVRPEGPHRGRIAAAEAELERNEQ